MEELSRKEAARRNIVRGLIAALIFGVLFLSSLSSFPVFHSIAEFFSVVVAFAMFMLVWNSRRYFDNGYLQFVGISFLFIGIIDFTHTLAYKGMNIFQGYDSNLPTQLWIAARYLQSVSLLVAPFFIGRRLNYPVVLTSYAAVGIIALVTIFLGVFPTCYVEGAGLTPFKKISEYIIALVFVASMALLLRRKDHFEPAVLKLLVWSIALTIVSELAFTFYISVYGLSNLVGHYFKIIAFYLIYRAIIVTGLMTPYVLLFRDLKQSEYRYRSLFGNMIDGFAYHRIVLDQNGNPVDYLFLEVNDAFERLTGLKRENIIGKKVTEALPGIERDKADWIGTYGKVALQGETAEFENYSEQLDKWFSVTAYSPQREYFTVMFEDITERKRMEERLHKENREMELATRILRLFVEESGDDLYSKVLGIVMEGLQSDHGVFGYIDERGYLICPSMTKMLDQCEIEGKCIHYPPEKWKGLWARALMEKRTLYVNKPPRVPPGHPIIHNNLAAPILFQGEVIGLLNLANKETGYSEADKELIDVIAGRIAPVLYAWILKEVRERERKEVEEALKESEQRVRLKLESILSPEGDIGNLELADIIDMRPSENPVFVVEFYSAQHSEIDIDPIFFSMVQK